MRIGWNVLTDGRTLGEIVAEIRQAADAGLHSVWFGQLLSWDAVTLAALAGQQVPGIELGTAITQTYPRHPIALAGQALTAQAAVGGRFTLGIGPSHPPIIEGVFGHSYDRPARHTREYLSALVPLLRGEQVEYRGETITAAGAVTVPGATPPQVLVSALGPVMLRVAGELSDGTVTTWITARSLGEHVVPEITRAAEKAGRPAPRVVAAAVAALTPDPGAVRRDIAARYSAASDLPAYRATLDRQGLTGVEQTVLAGDERALEQAIRDYADAGATDLVLSPWGDRTRLLAFLSELAARA
ncbi:F420-dependent oxidoreductase-like protein [Thermocatellispora tengchongensis]|uniref:F420-dependent oxidoreductase-like protein n=1 Tax=Thermocatellispora tengchongensis TaxID=1073253 RepID=A0A840NS70_9ACTN|nr:TIGR03564 family F420-dependent LLM class oxidoreductase [Thermocatellispora tengchongensis]MBB5130418.1 F420-dependent oxidoreductase-like protein [Thermocatellispora tengchongensis]